MDLDRHSFQVNLRGVIELLSGHLYSGPQVYLRELIQNGVDAISARRLVDDAFAGQVEFQLHSGDVPTLVVSDNGIGLTEKEVHQFLATIGLSSKRGAFDRTHFIGQFGIGMLSAFMVCDEIILITRSVQVDSPTVKWTGCADGTYSVEIIENRIQPGSQVYLRAKNGCFDFFEPSFVHTTLRRYGRYLSCPITLVSEGESKEINESPPWEDATEASSATTEEDGRRMLATIPLVHPDGLYQGVAHVLPQSLNTARRSGDEVYLKGMLVSENVDNLLPKWAFFVRCVLNVQDLRPTASRESFHDDESLAEARADLGGQLRDWLVKIAETDRNLLEQVIGVHHLPLKALAVEDDDFFHLFSDWLPFETTMGEMSLQEIRKQGRTIRYTHTKDQFRQIAAVAQAQGDCLVNGGYVFDSQLLQKAGRFLPGVEVQEVNSSEIAGQFRSLSTAENIASANFLQHCQQALQEFGCEAILRKFEPVGLPVLYTTDGEADFLRSIENSRQVSNPMFDELLGQLQSQLTDASLPQLCFNFSNRLVQRLMVVENAQWVQSSVQMLYLQSLLMGHYPLKPKEMTLLNNGLSNLLDLATEHWQEGEADE